MMLRLISSSSFHPVPSHSLCCCCCSLTRTSLCILPLIVFPFTLSFYYPYTCWLRCSIKSLSHFVFIVHCIFCLLLHPSIIPFQHTTYSFFLLLDGTLLCCLLVCDPRFTVLNVFCVTNGIGVEVGALKLCSTLHGAKRALCDQWYRCKSWFFEIGVERQVVASTTNHGDKKKKSNNWTLNGERVSKSNLKSV